MAIASLSNDKSSLKIDIVSIHSQVVYGSVGNNVAIPTFMNLNLTAVSVPTVLFSNIPNYPSINGGVIPSEWFSGYLRDLNAREAMEHVKAIQVGHLGSSAQAEKLAQWLLFNAGYFPNQQIILDPVLGDYEHGIYGYSGLVDHYKNNLFPLANGITPNGFELGLITGMPVDSINQVVCAARALISERTQWVVVTSAAPKTWRSGVITSLLVTEDEAITCTHPKINIEIAGTGDMFCAALTSYLVKGLTLPKSMVRASAMVLQALHRTQREKSRELLLPMESDEMENAWITLETVLA